MRTRLPLLLLSVWAFRAEAGCDTPCSLKWEAGWIKV